MGEPLFPRANRVRQLEHALSVLDLFRPPDRGELSLSAIADELGLSEEYANKLLRHLEAAGVVVRGPVSGGWRLGIRLAELGGYAIATLRPWDEFRPPLAALQDATGLGGLIAWPSTSTSSEVPSGPLGELFPPMPPLSARRSWPSFRRTSATPHSARSSSRPGLRARSWARRLSWMTCVWRSSADTR
jgi:biotin operon repressor